MWGCGGALPKPPRQLLKRGPNSVRASPKTSRCLAQYASVLFAGVPLKASLRVPPAEFAEPPSHIVPISIFSDRRHSCSGPPPWRRPGVRLRRQRDSDSLQWGTIRMHAYAGEGGAGWKLTTQRSTLSVSRLRPPTDSEQKRDAGVVVGNRGRERDVVQVHHERGGEGDFWSDLIFQRHPEWNEVAGIVAINCGWAAAAVQIGMQKTDPGERHEIESTIEAKMILGYGGHTDLCQVSDRREEGHPAKGKILVHVVVEPEAERECGVIGGPAPETEVGVEAPACLLHVGRFRWFGFRGRRP